MALAGSLEGKGNGPWQRVDAGGRLLVFLIFLLGLVIFTGLALRIISYGYINEYALSHWAKTISIFDAEEVRAEYLGFGYPHIPFYLLSICHFIPLLNSPFAPYFVSCLVSAILLIRCFLLFEKYGYSLPWRLILISLVASHPVFLWAATTGTQISFSMMIYFEICLAIADMPGRFDIKAIVKLMRAPSTWFRP